MQPVTAAVIGELVNALELSAWADEQGSTDEIRDAQAGMSQSRAALTTYVTGLEALMADARPFMQSITEDPYHTDRMVASDWINAINDL